MKQLVFFFFFLYAIPSIAQVYNDAYWQVNDATTQVAELDVFGVDVNILVDDPDQLAYELHTDVLEVDFTSTAQNASNFYAFNIQTIAWEGSAPSYFTTDINGNPVSHKQCNGYSVDFSLAENRVITFEIQSNEDFELWTNIFDIQGKCASADAPRMQIYATQGGVDTANEQKWQQVVLSWDSSVTGTAQNIGSLQDMYTNSWWSRLHMINLQQNPQELNLAHIVQASFFVNPLNPTYGEYKNFFIRNLKIGNGNVPPNPENLWLVDDQTTNVPFISVLTPTLETKDNFITTVNTQSFLEASRINDMLRVTSNKFEEQSWDATKINLMYFDGETGNAFVYNEVGNTIPHDILKGYSVDFTNPENQMVTFQIQASHDLVLRMDLLDRIGRASNSEMLEVQIEQTPGGIDYYDEQKWHSVTLAWNNTIVADAYITEISDFWGSMFWNKQNPDVTQTSTPLDIEAIIGLLMYIDPGNHGEIGVEKSVVLKNLVIGKFQEGVNISYNPDNWQVEDNTVSTSGVYGVEKLRIDQDPIHEIIQNDGYTQITYASNGWSDIKFFTNTWAGTSSEYFTKDLDGNSQEHKISEGSSINMADVARRIVSVEIQSDVELELLFYLIDIAGKNSNKYLPQVSIIPTEGGVDLDDEQKWRTVTFAWDTSIDADAVVPAMADLYSNMWNYRSTQSLGLGFSYPLDSSRIVGVGLYADPTLSFSGTKTLYIRNLIIGTPIFKPVSPIVIST